MNRGCRLILALIVAMWTAGLASSGRASVPAVHHAPSWGTAEAPTGSLDVSDSPSAAAQPVRAMSRPLGLGSAALKTGNTIRGIASWVPARYGVRYLALPEGAGVRVRLCGAARCVVMTSNDAGPDLAMQRHPYHRVADIGVLTWERLTGLPRSRGLAWVTVTR